MKNNAFDVLIIGSGAAGQSLALSLATHFRVALASKGELIAGSSPRAQGGIAAVMNQEDSFASHIADTHNAGAGLCQPDAVEFCVTQGKKAIEWLIDRGVTFSTDVNDNHALHLTQEGGHSHRRILHVADKTGVAIVKTLAEQVQQHPNIHCLVQHTAIDLITQDNHCVGAMFYHNTSHEIYPIFAKKTVLATGGASRCYLHTSNGNQTSGDGIAMAYRQGARVANLEFNQFHPTTLYHPKAESFLISEALRGEGAILKNLRGERFMAQYDTRLELAPRDIVARAIDCELKKHQDSYVLLDISQQDKGKVLRLFPTIAKRCHTFGIDITKEAIPVVPAAHYTCGGVITDLNGQTDIEHLYAIGEVACTGLHGANRMASNSLLECLVFAMSASKDIEYHLKKNHQPIATNQMQLPQYNKQQTSTHMLPLRRHIRETLWMFVGIVRNNHRLMQAKQAVDKASALIEAQCQISRPDKTLIECRNLAHVAGLIIESALLRKESRGLHYNLDYPDTLERAHDTLLQKKTVKPFT